MLVLWNIKKKKYLLGQAASVERQLIFQVGDIFETLTLYAIPQKLSDLPSVSSISPKYQYSQGLHNETESSFGTFALNYTLGLLHCWWKFTAGQTILQPPPSPPCAVEHHENCSLLHTTKVYFQCWSYNFRPKTSPIHSFHKCCLTCWVTPKTLYCSRFQHLHSLSVSLSHLSSRNKSCLIVIFFVKIFNYNLIGKREAHCHVLVRTLICFQIRLASVLLVKWTICLENLGQHFRWFILLQNHISGLIHGINHSNVYHLNWSLSGGSGFSASFHTTGHSAMPAYDFLTSKIRNRQRVQSHLQCSE